MQTTASYTGVTKYCTSHGGIKCDQINYRYKRLGRVCVKKMSDNQ